MDKIKLKHRIEYALNHIHKYDIEVEHIIWSDGEIAIRSKKTDELMKPGLFVIFKIQVWSPKIIKGKSSLITASTSFVQPQ